MVETGSSKRFLSARRQAGMQAGGRAGMQMVMRRFYQPPRLPSSTAGCLPGGGSGDSGGRGINQNFASPGRIGMHGRQRLRDRTLALAGHRYLEGTYLEREFMPSFDFLRQSFEPKRRQSAKGRLYSSILTETGLCQPCPTKE